MARKGKGKYWRLSVIPLVYIGAYLCFIYMKGDGINYQPSPMNNGCNCRSKQNSIHSNQGFQSNAQPKKQGNQNKVSLENNPSNNKCPSVQQSSSCQAAISSCSNNCKSSHSGSGECGKTSQQQCSTCKSSTCTNNQVNTCNNPQMNRVNTCNNKGMNAGKNNDPLKSNDQYKSAKKKEKKKKKKKLQADSSVINLERHLDKFNANRWQETVQASPSYPSIVQDPEEKIIAPSNQTDKICILWTLLTDRIICTKWRTFANDFSLL